MYLYVPFRNQNDLPVFDTGAADLNLVQLFRTNRYVGADRLSDANQISIGVTSRLLDADTGKQFISGTIGQAYYFDEPRVALPGEVLDDPESSDIIAELDVTAFGDWNVGMGVQWDPGETRSEKGDVQLQYKPEFDRVVNLGYRFRRDSIEQVDGSVAWPIGERLERVRAPRVLARGRDDARPVRRPRIPLLLLADPRRRAPLRQRPHRRPRHQLPAAA